MKTLNNVVAILVVLVLSFVSVVPVQAQTLLEQAMRKAEAQTAQNQQNGGGPDAFWLTAGVLATAAGVWGYYEFRQCSDDYEVRRERGLERCEHADEELGGVWMLFALGGGAFIAAFMVGDDDGRQSKLPQISVNQKGGQARWTW